MSSRNRDTAKRRIRAGLMRKNKTMRSWALERGFKPRTVAVVVDRWAGKDTQPQGPMAYNILRGISQEIGREIVPGILED